MDVFALPASRLVVLGRHRLLGKPREDVTDAGLAGFVADQARDDTVLDRTAHALDERELVAEEDVAVARPHDHDHRAGLGHGRRRRRDVRVDVGNRDGRSGAKSGERRRSFAQHARSAARRQERAGHLLVDDVLELWVESGEVGAVREPVLLRPERLVAGGAGVASLGAGELPDDPVGGLDQPLGAVIELGRLVEDLERLREEPLRRDLAAVPVEPRLSALCRDGVDAIGLGLSGVMLPELDPRVRFAAQLLEQAERRPVGGRRQHRARGEVDADPDHVVRGDAGLREHLGNGVLERAHVVLRVLQRPVGLQPDVIVRRRQPFVDDAVRVGIRRGCELAPVCAVDQDGPSRRGAEVDADHVGAAAHRGCP